MTGADVAMGLLMGLPLGLAIALHPNRWRRALFRARPVPEVPDGSAPAERAAVPRHQAAPHAAALHPLFESVTECVEVLDRDGVVRRMNGAGLAFRNQNHVSRVVGRPMFEVIKPEYCEAFRRLMESGFSGLPGLLEYQIATADGRPRWLETYAVPLHGPGGDVSALLAVSRDVTANRNRGRRKEDARRPTHGSFDGALECVKLQDPSGVIIAMNAAGLPLLEAPRLDMVLGREVYEFITPEYRDHYRAMSVRARNGERSAVEFEVLCANGERRWVETHTAPLYDGDGGVTALLAITRAVADHKSIEEGLRRQRSELAHMCRLSTMGEMASGLAHELNQPLCAISSYAQTAELLSQEADPELKRVLDKIVGEAERASQIIQRVREFVRNQGPKLVPMKPALVAEGAIQLVESERRRLGIRLQVELEDGLPVLMADRIQIEQVLLNLIMNAMQAASDLPQPERQLSLTVRRGDHGTVQFTLCNRGTPIPHDVAACMFTPFYTTKEKGMGMGLAISRSIIEAHNGTIGYRDYPAGGACFYFNLPAVSE